MQDEWKFYHLSEKMNLMGPILGFMFGTLAAFALSFVYAYVVVYIPFVYINFLISYGFVVIVCIAYKVGETKGQNRSRFLSFVSTTVMATLCLYMAWVAFLFVLSRHPVNYFILLLNPVGVIKVIFELVGTGWFSIGSGNISGGFYAIILIIEAAGYYILFWWLAMLEADRVFCENCSKWIDPVDMPYLIDTKIEPEIKETANTGSIPWIDKLELSDNIPAILFSQTICDTCDQISLLSAKSITLEIKDDKPENHETPLFKNLIMNKRVWEDLKKKLDALTEERKKAIAVMEKRKPEDTTDQAENGEILPSNPENPGKPTNPVDPNDTNNPDNSTNQA